MSCRRFTIKEVEGEIHIPDIVQGRISNSIPTTYTRLDDTSTNLHHVERVVVAASASVGVNVSGVFPGLREATVVEVKVSLLEL